MWFGVFQAGIAYSDLKADCGGRRSTCKVAIRRPNPRGDTAGMGIWIACIDTARIVR